MKGNRLTFFILLAMVLGVAVGYVVHDQSSPEFIKKFANNIKLLTTIFLRLVQMIIAPLVFTTLVVGIAKLGDLKAVGRVGGKAMLWFVSASLVSLLLGLVLVNFFHPGTAIDLSNADNEGAKELLGKTQEFSLAKFVEHVFPKSVFEAMATNEILQLVVFSIFFGVAATALGDYSKPVIKALDVASHIILKIVGYVMNFAPLGVFGAIAAIIAVKGLQIFNFYALYFLYFLIGIALLWTILWGVGYLILRDRIPHLFKRISQPLLIAFSTTSSEAVFPKLTEELERFGCKDKIVSFILPLGYSFNLDGSMMYMTFASITIAQAYGVHLDIGTQITMLVVFAETGLLVGFLFPGDSLLFAAGIYLDKLTREFYTLGETGDVAVWQWMTLVIMVMIASVLGNIVGYWFGQKTGPLLYERKD